MPHISKHRLNPKLSDQIFRKLVSIFEKAAKKEGFSAALVNELFTKTEKVMFAKRLAIILMLSGAVPHHKITEILKVSPSTVAKISLQIEIGKYDSILNVSRQEKVDIEKLVWKILTVNGLMPPRMSSGYWRKYSKNKS